MPFLVCGVVFNNDKGEFFIHNDMFLPSYPICIEWMDFNPKKEAARGHYVAVGCMEPEILVWDLNLTGCLEPAFTLGSIKKKSMKHSDAVLDLAWHKDNRYV
jgi:periodic tryptophan protein 1